MLIEHVKYELTCKSHRVVFRYTPFVVDWVKSGTPSHSDPLPDQSLLLVNCQRYISVCADGAEEKNALGFLKRHRKCRLRQFLDQYVID